MEVLDLIQYDQSRNCFVLKAFMKTYPLTWPDGTPKSTNNAFNWRGTAATATPTPAKPSPRSRDLNSNGDVNAYSKASIARVPYGRTKKFKDFTDKLKP